MTITEILAAATSVLAFILLDLLVRTGNRITFRPGPSTRTYRYLTAFFGRLPTLSSQRRRIPRTNTYAASPYKWPQSNSRNLETAREKRGRQWVAAFTGRLPSQAILSRNQVGADLRGARMPRTYCVGIDFTGSYFNEADLRQARFDGSNFERATIRSATLLAADINSSNMDYATMTPLVVPESQTDMAIYHATWGFEWDNDSIERYVAYDEPDRHRPTILADARLNSTSFRSSDMRFVIAPRCSCLYAVFDLADLSYSDFSQARCENVSMAGTELRFSNFSRAILSNSNLRGAKCDSAVFVGADLDWASVTYVVGAKADFADASMVCADLSGSQLPNSRFRYANLSMANAKGARFFDSNFHGANLSGADFTEANIWGCKLQFANLVGATFDDAVADELGLDPRFRLEGATFSQATRWPPEWDPDSIMAMSDNVGDEVFRVRPPRGILDRQTTPR